MVCSVHITTVHPPFDPRIFEKEIHTLLLAGFDVTLIAQHDKNETVNGVKILALPKPRTRIKRFFYITWRAFRIALRQEAEIFHFHDPELLPVALLLKLIKGKKIIYDVHEDYHKQILSKPYIPKLIRKEIAFLAKIVEYCCSTFFDGIVTATDDILTNFSHHKQALSIKNYPKTSNSGIPAESLKKASKEFCLVYAGVLAEIRGISQIIKALNFIDGSYELKLILCGRFYPKNYELEIRALDGYEKVEYLGWVKHDDLPMLLKKCDAGLACLLPLPNYITALASKIFEYMAAGLPVIASNFPLWKVIVESNGCGICVDPLNSKAIAEAITYLMDHPESRQEMGKNGRRAVLEKYNWEAQGKKLIALYHLLCLKDREQ